MALEKLAPLSRSEAVGEPPQSPPVEFKVPPGPIPEVKVHLSLFTSVQEVSKIFEGLHALHRAGTIRLSIVSAVATSPAPRVVRLSIHYRVGITRQIAIDLSDQQHLFSIEDLQAVDTYFKRSFSQEAVAALPAQLASKIRPFGLNNPTITLGTALQMIAARLGSGRRPGGLARDARQLLALPSPRDFERSPDTPAEPRVLFQTRVWPPIEGDPDVLAINEERAALVRALRGAFGHRFLGGIVPSAFAKENYSDLITTLPSSMRAYPALVKQPLVAVYSRGLHGSTAFKMSEYLAASCCIVSHAPSTTLPEPLIENSHFSPFSSPDECVTQCEHLLRSPNLAEKMRYRNWAYYTSHVEPAAHLGRTLYQALATSPESGS